MLPGAAGALLDGLPDPVVVVDRRSTVIEANRAARALLPGLRPGQALALGLRHPDVLDGVEAVFLRKGSLRVDYSARLPTERTFEVQISALAVGSETGDGAALLYFRDLTEARRLERMRVDFVANVSHELRTPLASLLGFVETLQGPARNDPAARDRFLEIMRGQARRMARLIDDLLSLSRIEMRAHVAPQSPVEMQPLLAHMAETLASLAAERGVAIRLHLADEPLRVPGDRDELLRLVDNLVENAVKYGESGRFVDVTLARAPERERRRGEVMLSVRDYGPGIAPEHLPRLTERFYRADVAESRAKGGTGLGLAIVKHIVARHRGQLAIESEPGAGALFTVLLPEYRGPAA
ncbi:MAG TPA: ATP-binding protein [Microvirga sp.]|jgi:two-component system phosphate regulon sensor histidine kinase PhoR|nr:ATP-binding protein [Microvirga sp.]